jgi:hypothetical protein
VQGAGTVRTGGRGGAVTVQGEFPAPPVDRGEVVEAAQRHEIGQAGRPAAGSGDDVVDVAHAGGLVAAGKGAVRMAGGHRAAQVRGNGLARRADVQGQADRCQRPTVQGSAQPRGQPVRAGQGIGGQAEQRLPQPTSAARAAVLGGVAADAVGEQERVGEPIQGGPVHVPGHHRHHGGVTQRRLGFRAGQPAGLGGPRGRPGILGRRSAGRAPQLRQRQVHQHLRRLPRPGRYHPGPDQPPACLLQSVVTPLRTGADVFGPGLLA